RVEAEAVVGPGAVLGAGSWLEAGAHVEAAVLWEEVRVGPMARLQGCLVGRSARIGAHAEVPPGVVLGDESTLSDYSRLGSAFARSPSAGGGPGRPCPRKLAGARLLAQDHGRGPPALRGHEDGADRALEGQGPGRISSGRLVERAPRLHEEGI